MQFHLQTLLLAFVVVWSSMAVFGPWGFVFALFLLAAIAYIRSAESMWRAAVNLILIVVCALFLLAMLLPTVSGAREAARRCCCMNNLKQILLALHNYHDTYKCFPPAYIADANGKPMHSWRVLILPYLEESSLYEQYDFDEAWDGPNNSKLAASMPTVYRCPSAGKAGANAPPMASYAAVVGPQTAWPGAKSSNLNDFRDGSANTIMLLEVADSDIHWMEPRDLAFEEVLSGSGGESGPHIWSRHEVSGGYFFHHGFGVCAAFADGSVRFYRGIPTAEALKAMLTIDGGEQIDIENIELDPGSVNKPNWSNCIAVAVLVVSVALLLFRPRRKEHRDVNRNEVNGLR